MSQTASQSTMNRDRLYLLKPGFREGGTNYFCPGCAEVVGLLEFYPVLKQHLELHYIDYPRPRPELAALLGDENQSCPVLVLGSLPPNLPAHLKVQHANGHSYVEDPRAIANYLAHLHGTGLPH